MDRIVFWDASKETAEDRIRWNPSEHDKARIKRLTVERGRYINCRHFRKRPDHLFDCIKNGNSRKDCNNCNTCPNCEGQLAFYRRRVEKGQDRDCIYIAKSCVMCGAYVEEEYVRYKTRDKTPRVTDSRKCQVSGCPNTAYEGHVHKEFIGDRECEFVICEGHRRRIKTWRLHPDKGEQDKPIMIQLGKLVDNPKYKRTRKGNKSKGE